MKKGICILSALCLILISFAGGTSHKAYASNTGLQKYIEDTDISYLERDGERTIYDVNKSIKRHGASLFVFMTTIGITVLVVYIIIAGVKMSYKKNAQDRTDAKSHLGYLVLAGAILSCIIGIIGMISEFAGGI